MSRADEIVIEDAITLAMVTCEYANAAIHPKREESFRVVAEEEIQGAFHYVEMQVLVTESLK